MKRDVVSERCANQGMRKITGFGGQLVASWHRLIRECQGRLLSRDGEIYHNALWLFPPSRYLGKSYPHTAFSELFEDFVMGYGFADHDSFT